MLGLREFLTFTALTMPLTAFAENDKVARGPTPLWVNSIDPIAVPNDASGLAFFRHSDALIHLDDGGRTEYTGFRIRILHPNALQLGNLSIAWNPASGQPTIHRLILHRNGESIDYLNKAIFEVLRREDQLEQAMLSGTLTAVSRIADLRVGDELEFAYSTRILDPTLGDLDAGFLFLAPNPAPGRFRLGVSWANGHKPTLKMTPDLTAAAVQNEGAIALQFDNPASVNLPKDAPPRYLWSRVLEFSDFADWQSVSQQFEPHFRRASTLAANSPLKKEASRIAAAHASALDRASAALKLVQQDVRYIYVGLNGGNYRPATADETWERRYGDCKGKTTLLLAMLAELGIEAEALLVNANLADDALEGRLANPGMFNHVLVRATIDGKEYFLDGTLPPVVPPALEPFQRYHWMLPLRADGAAVEKREWRPSETPDEINIYEIDATAGFDKPAQKTSTMIMRGLAGLQQYMALSSLTPADLQQKLSADFVGDYWQSIDEIKWSYNQKAQASILTISGSGLVDWEDDRGGSKSISLPGGGFSPPDRRVRSKDQDQTAPFFKQAEFSCHVTVVKPPQGTLPRQWSVNKGFDTKLFGQRFYRAFDYRNGSIRMVRGTRIEQQEIDAISAAADNGRLAAFDNSMAWLYFDPTGPTAPKPNKQPIPTISEFDWTSANVPCLANADPGGVGQGRAITPASAARPGSG